MIDYESKERLYVCITNLTKVRIARKIITDILPSEAISEKERVTVLEILDDWEDGLNVIIEKEDENNA